MKKIILALGVCLMVGAQANAQQEERKEMNPEERAEEITKKYSEKLDLNEDQRKEVYEANLELMELGAENRKEMDIAHKKHDEKMKEILSEEQFEMYSDAQKSRRKKMHHRMRQDDMKESREMRRAPRGRSLDRD